MSLLKFFDFRRNQVLEFHCFHEWLLSQNSVDVKLVSTLKHHIDVFIEVLI
jgi:hypothetical protein